MKKVISMIALAAITFGSVYAIPSTPVKASMQTDTTKKKKKTKRDSTKKKDTMNMKAPTLKH
jgi:hypothetical protein